MGGDAFEAYAALLRAVWRAWGLDALLDAPAPADEPRAPPPRAPAPFQAQAPHLAPAPRPCPPPADRAARPAFDLCRTKGEIDAVARHAGTLADHVAALGGRVRALEEAFDARLERLGREVLGALDEGVAKVSRAAPGGGPPAAVAELKAAELQAAGFQAGASRPARDAPPPAPREPPAGDG